jgi:hypothetical protein
MMAGIMATAHVRSRDHMVKQEAKEIREGQSYFIMTILSEKLTRIP